MDNNVELFKVIDKVIERRLDERKRGINVDVPMG
jgi:hypothetical protein